MKEITLINNVLEIDKDYLSDLIGLAISEMGGTTKLNIWNDVIVNQADYVLVIQAQIDHILCLTIDFDHIQLVGENDCYELNFDDLFVDQCVSKAIYYINN